LGSLSRHPSPAHAHREDSEADPFSPRLRPGHVLHCNTNRKGSCSITFPASYGKGKHTAKATKSGYAAATTGLRVR
jgi:hypothetical protein